MSEQNSKAMESLFDERRNFIIIGLTGRTGSGCSKVAELLSKEFKELNPPEPKNSNYSNNEERKYNIVYEYAKINWDKFIVIETKNVITSFMLEETFDDLQKYLISMFTEDYPNIKSVLDVSFIERYETLHKKRIEQQYKIKENEENLKEDEVFNFYFLELPEFTNELKEKLDSIDKKIYTSLYQKLANNVRSSGKAFITEFNSNNIFRMPQRTNALIKILRKRNKDTKGRVLVVIDAIRNPYEAVFFKDRYSSFYLFSINTEENERKNRLFNIGLNKEQINKLDSIEYPEKLCGDKKFWSQNIQSCIELSDVYIHNIKDDLKELNSLKRMIIRYVMLIMHPGLVTPTHVERCMQIAYNAKMNSGCLSRQVGAVVTDENYSIKSVGWNTTPEYQVPCNLRLLKNLVHRSDKDAFSTYELSNEEFCNECISKLNSIDKKELYGRNFEYCFKDIFNGLESQKGKKNQVHTRSLHAEENAFLQLSKYGGIGIMGGYLFSTASPCELCAKKAYQLGIKLVYYIDPYPGISKEQIFECGYRKPKMVLFEGAIGRGFVQLYTQIMPFKDELEMLVE